MERIDQRFREFLFAAASEVDDAALLDEFVRILKDGDMAHAVWLQDVLVSKGEAEKFIRGLEKARAIAVLETGEDLLGEDLEPASSSEVQGLPEDLLGKKISKYRILERIGEGGGGIVYLAEQREPVHKMVALKVIRIGMDTERVIARFAGEKQSLSMMDHPNIARVLDGGATETGRPFFVMERVEGLPITVFCDENRLDLRARIELFIATCAGIQHAHQKGVIHRDIKPSNILVTRVDGKPSPRVIDFGIAKAIEVDAGISTAMTVNDLFSGTPAYMSPEQADLKSPDVDTRSDVYGLGVLLYELLTGTTPFDAERLAEAGLRELRRIIVEEDPPVPSAKVAALPQGTRNKIAGCRRVDPDRLAAEIRGDLDSVVMKALEKERQCRYETVEGLMMDLQRHLEFQPVLARPQGRLYLLGKFVRRNRLGVGASAAVIASMCLGLGVASVSYWKERRSKEEQARLRRIAEEAHHSERQQLAETREWENMAQISMLLSEGKLEAADEKLRGTPLESMKITPQSAGVLRSLGNWNALSGRWSQAANSFILLMRANELNGGGDSLDMDILLTGAALAERGKQEDYDRFREWTLRHMKPDTDEITAERVLHATLLRPCSESFLVRLDPFTKRLEQAEFNPMRLKGGWPSESAAWKCWALALHDYRAERFLEAREWIRKGLEIPVRPRFMPALLHSVMAMCEYRLGNPVPAGASLDLAGNIVSEAFDPDLPAAYEPFGKQQGFWWDWIVARMLYHEARQLAN